MRGLFGEGTEAVGDFYQLSNQVTLGVREEDVVAQFNDIVVPRIVGYEHLARRKLLDKQQDALDDKIQRALGVLGSARLMEGLAIEYAG